MNFIAISKRTILRTVVSGLILSASLVTSAQTAGNFAGKWELDHSKSDAEFKSYQITCTIVQSATEISVKQDFVTEGGEKSSMLPITFNLEGKEISKEEQGGIDKISASLSPDKKTLSTKFVRTMNGNDYGSMTIYILSDDGKTLTVKITDLKGESPMVQVYNRK
jgi:hypothetical protein